MSRLCLLDGIIIWVNTRDHLPPHFHARYSGDGVRIELDDLAVMTGQLSPAKQRLLLTWAAIRKDELVRNWDLARQVLLFGSTRCRHVLPVLEPAQPAQAHLPTTISVDGIVEPTGSNVGPVALRQICELISDLPCTLTG